jgi:APA family basic amino acid/polyamine antiporter
MPEPELTRRIGAVGATTMLVGFVIGISIFILPGTLAVTAGPAVIVSYFLAALLAVFSCVIAAQLGVAFPVSGGSFVAISRLLSPFSGFIAVWIIIGAGAVAVALLAYGFADYAASIWPAVDRRVAALLLVAALGGLNLTGIRDTVLGQGVMVALFMTALTVFCAYGLANIDPENLRPFAPNGLAPVVVATIPAFFSYTGFMVIIEIGGEIREPQRNIPRALAFSFVIVLITYSLVALAIVGVVPWRELGDVAAPVHAAASRIMPSAAVTAITLTALAAAASSINILLLGYSRDLYALARAGVLPAILARLSRRHGEPGNCVLLFVVIALSIVTAGGSVTDFATLTVVGMLLLQIALGMAALKMPRKTGIRLPLSEFHLRGPLLLFFAVGLIVVSLMFLAVVLLDSPGLAAVAAGYVGAGAIFYLGRRRQLAGRGLRLAQMIADS